MNEMALTVLKDRYLQPNEKNWCDLSKRVADAIGTSEEERCMFYNLISEFKFIPNSPTLMNAGTPNGQLSACFVIPVEDSIEGIGEAITNSMIISKSGGGVGYSFGKLRSSGSRVKTTNGVASGPVSFMKIFDTATDAIKQGGKRRGANMGVLPCDHPDLFEFIHCKEEDGVLSNFNISVGITDKFMQCALSGLPFYNRDGDEINATSVLKDISKCMWSNGEPGVVFLDTINKDNPFDEPIEATNPCGEQPLIPWGSCNLGSIDVSKYFKDGQIDWISLSDDISLAVYFLNRVIDKNCYPLPEIAECAYKYRPIGLGIMGFADLLIMKGLIYGSEKSLIFAGEFMEAFRIAAEFASARFADENNCRKNATVMSLAPTGTISMFAECSSGIEPNFAFEYERRVKDMNGVTNTYIQKHPLAAKYGDSSLPTEFITAFNVTPERHIEMQSVLQVYCDTGISKTINVPTEASSVDVVEYISQAWSSGCKGFTMYRDGSRSEQVLSTPTVEPVPEPKIILKRPKELNGKTFKVTTGCGTLLVTVNSSKNRPYEVIIKTTGKGGCQATLDAMARMISMNLRNDVPVDRIVKHLRVVKCDRAIMNKKSDGKSCSDIVGKCILETTKSPVFWESDKIIEVDDSDPDENDQYKCPECGGAVYKAGGCWECYHCGACGCS